MNLNRRRCLKYVNRMVMAIVCFGYASLYAAPSKADSRKPNVVIFFTDDQGTLDANCYGSKDLYTPNMDKLAKQVYFSRRPMRIRSAVRPELC